MQTVVRWIHGPGTLLLEREVSVRMRNPAPFPRGGGNFTAGTRELRWGLLYIRGNSGNRWNLAAAKLSPGLGGAQGSGLALPRKSQVLLQFCRTGSLPKSILLPSPMR